MPAGIVTSIRPSAEATLHVQAISKVTQDDIKHAADTYLDLRGSVTGYLVPEELAGEGRPVEQPVAQSLRETR